MADIFSKYITHDTDGNDTGLNYSISNQTVSKAVIAAAETIKKIIREEDSEACTYDACFAIARKTADYFGSQQLK